MIEHPVASVLALFDIVDRRIVHMNPELQKKRGKSQFGHGTPVQVHKGENDETITGGLSAMKALPGMGTVIRKVKRG